mmetsp:Transcript_99630/g.281175  ORF Transcript_99630/g.281175 Transcript_99630/m.281175 type:complete len:974 (-) Transcript_99630:131-3052(-)
MAAVTAPPPEAVPAALGLSEAWEVQERHVGCFTGGKVCWSEANKSICCLCSEELHLVDAETRAATRRVVQEGDGILTFAVDRSGLNACTSHRSGLLRHFKLAESPELVRSWRAHDQVVSDVCFDATGALVASGSVDRTVKVWDFTGYFCTHNFRGHTALVSIVRFHPAKLQVVSVADVEVRLWDLEASTCVGVMKDHLTSISSISFAKAKGAYQLVTGGRDQVVNVWRLEPKCALVRSVPIFENVEGVATLPTAKLQKLIVADTKEPNAFVRWLKKDPELPPYLFVTAGDKCQLRLWSPIDGRCVATRASPHAAKGVFRQVHYLDQTPCGMLLTIGEDLNLVLWALPDVRVCGYIMGQNEEIVHVQLIPQFDQGEAEDPADKAGDVLANSAKGPTVSADRFVCIANDEHPRVVNCEGFGASLLRGHTDVVISCDVSADGRWIATGGKDQSVRVWSSTTCVSVCKLAGHAGAVSALSFPKRLPKGGLHSPAAAVAAKQPLWLVSGSHDKTMKIWECPSPAKLEECAAAADIDSGGAPSPDHFVEKSTVTVVAHSKEVNDVVVSPNNKLIASAGQDKLVRIWQFPSGDLLGECKGHRRGVWCVAFSPIDQVIASASGDTTVRIWNLRDYTAIRSFQGHGSAVLRVCFLSGGMQLMTSGVDGLLKLWQIRTADCAATFEEHVGKVWCIDLLGDRMVSGGSDSKLCVWRDVTSERAKARHDAKADAVMKDSKIGLLMQDGKIEEALTLALDLDRPGQMRQILTDHAMDVISRSVAREADAEDADDQDGSEASADLKGWMISLSSERLGKLMDLLEQWNSNRKMASLAQMLMGLVLQVVPPSKLVAIEGMNAMCGSFLSYGSRHMARVDALMQKAFLFDLVLQGGNQGLSIQPGLDDGAAAEGALKRTMEVLLAGTQNGVDEEGEDCEDSNEDDGDGRPLNGGSEEVAIENAAAPASGCDAAAKGGAREKPRKRRKAS